MKRLPAVAFAALAVATVFAFFLTQALKTAPPLVAGRPGPIPVAFNPVSGKSCWSSAKPPTLIDYRRTQVTIGVYRTETVAVYVIDNVGDVVATLSSGDELRPGPLNTWKTFSWDGRESGGEIAPDGIYYFRVEVVNKGRTLNLSYAPITIITHAPHPTITSVTVAGAKSTTGKSTNGKSTTAKSTSGPAVITPHADKVRIRFPNHDYRRVSIDIYRTDLAKPRLISEFKVKKPGTATSATWNGEIDGKPAPAGTYMIGITAQNPACDQAKYPVAFPPSPGTTPGTGVTVRYLAATPPLTPTPAGTNATVAVDSPVGPYTWALRLGGQRKLLRQGSGATGNSQLNVRLPGGAAGLYTLTLKAGGHTTVVPLVASGTSARSSGARVLVVLPILTWQGTNPVDDDGDGLPDTLTAGDKISLDRPFTGSLTPAMQQDVALLSYLRSHRIAYQLTTDIGLAQGVGPSLVDRWGVALAGPETWLPQSLAVSLKDFVEGGGRVLSLGTGALRGRSHITGYPASPVASAPKNSSTDVFGASHGPLTSTDGDLITELSDQLGILASVPALSGFHAYEPIEPPSGVEVSAAGVSETSAPAVTAYKLDRGYVVEIGLTNFNLSLATNVDSQELLTSVWQLLSK